MTRPSHPQCDALHIGVRAQLRGWITLVGGGGGGMWCGGGGCSVSYGGSAIFQGDVSGGLFVAF